MKKSMVYSLVAWLVSGLVTACNKEDPDEVNQNNAPIQNTPVFYDGVWSVGQQVVDTARLEVSTDMKIRLPEDYLASLCLLTTKGGELPTAIAGKGNIPENSWGSSTNVGSAGIKPNGMPVTLRNMEQGYSDNGQYYSVCSPSSGYESDERPSIGNSLYDSGTFSFYATKDGVDYRILLFSDERPTSIYRVDTGLWTISIPIDGFLITNLETMEQRRENLSIPITIYYNAKSSISQ